MKIVFSTKTKQLSYEAEAGDTALDLKEAGKYVSNVVPEPRKLAVTSAPADTKFVVKESDGLFVVEAKGFKSRRYTASEKASIIDKYLSGSVEKDNEYEYIALDSTGRDGEPKVRKVSIPVVKALMA